MGEERLRKGLEFYVKSWICGWGQVVWTVAHGYSEVSIWTNKGREPRYREKPLVYGKGKTLTQTHRPKDDIEKLCEMEKEEGREISNRTSIWNQGESLLFSLTSLHNSASQSFPRHTLRYESDAPRGSCWARTGSLHKLSSKLLHSTQVRPYRARRTRLNKSDGRRTCRHCPEINQCLVSAGVC